MCKRLHSGLLQSNLMLAEPASKLLNLSQQDVSMHVEVEYAMRQVGK